MLSVLLPRAVDLTRPLLAEVDGWCIPTCAQYPTSPCQTLPVEGRAALPMNMATLLVASTQDTHRGVLFHQFLINNDFPCRPGTRSGDADSARLVIEECAA